jgi:hypothetical protein
MQPKTKRVEKKGKISKIYLVGIEKYTVKGEGTK